MSWLLISGDVLQIAPLASAWRMVLAWGRLYLGTSFLTYFTNGIVDARRALARTEVVPMRVKIIAGPGCRRPPSLGYGRSWTMTISLGAGVVELVFQLARS